MGFKDSLKYLAAKYNIEIPELAETAFQRDRRLNEQVQMRALTAAQEVFASTLWSPRGEKVREYLRKRSFTDESIREFGFGAAFDSPGSRELVQTLQRQNLSPQTLEAASLASPSTRERGTWYDYFRNRLMIPIRDELGRIIAFAGRALDDNPAKYVNSRETDTFHKGSTLFGIDRARAGMKEHHRAILVEGYMDVMQLWQRGFPETVACMGTALTVAHLRQIRKYTNHLFLLFDGDSAGQKASLSAVNAALEVPEVSVKVALLPAGKDPDEFLIAAADPKAALEELLSKATDLLDHAIGSRLTKAGPMEIPSLVNREFIPWLRQVEDRVQRAFLATRLAQLSNVPLSAIESQLHAQNQAQRQADAAARQQKSGPMSSPSPQGAQKAVSTEAPERPVTARALKPLEYELLGHLYFAQPGELDLAAMTTLLRETMALDDIWEEFAEEALETLVRGQSPVTLARDNWHCAWHPSIGRLLDRFTTAAHAFHSDQRAAMIERLRKARERERIQETISLLRTQVAALAKSEPDECRRILTEIQSLQKSVES